MTEIRRQRRKTLTDKMVAALPRKSKRYVLADPELRGMYVRVPPQGPAVYAAVARSPGPLGKQVWATLGSADVLTVEAAREAARSAIKRIREGRPAFEPPPVQPDTVADVAAGWLERHVKKNKLRTGYERQRVLERHVLPHFGGRPFAAIRRSDVAALLDRVEDKHGPWVADSVLAVLRALATWFATRNDDYVPPFARGMRRVATEARNRSRVLNDDELRAVWRAAEAAGSFGAFLRLLLLTGQRREKVATLKWSDLDGDTWTIATAPREKGNPGVLKLPPLAVEIVAAQPRLASNPFVFPGRADGPLGAFAERHAALRAACGVDGWTLHDLRRTARSLLTRAGVISEHAERVLGHVLAGVEGTYNRHEYRNEKAIALAKLATLIERIVAGTADNVVALHEATVS
jgi:integrase